MLWDWCGAKFEEWLKVRKLQEFITPVKRWVWKDNAYDSGMAFTYRYEPPTSDHQRTHHLVAQTHPVMRVAARSHEAYTSTITTYHGTTFPGLARILHTHMSCWNQRVDFMGWRPMSVTLVSTLPRSSAMRLDTRYHLAPSMTTFTVE